MGQHPSTDPLMLLLTRKPTPLVCVKFSAVVENVLLHSLVLSEALPPYVAEPHNMRCVVGKSMSQFL